jgi:RND family efflux transporter MFP subunit
MTQQPKTRGVSAKTRDRLTIIGLILATIILIGAAYHVIGGIVLRRHTNQEAVMKVAVIKAAATPSIEEIILPGNVQAWHEATIFARTNGYIKEWKTDIGAHVKAGDLLAEIETPELNAQLQQAEADLKTAEANNQLAQSTAKRWIVLLKTDSVSKQEADEKVSDALAKAALVNAARANRDRLKELVGFERVVAPFDGIITSRTTDIGSLISEGSTTQRPLFHIVQADPLRVYVRVPQNYSARISPDMKVELEFAEHPGKLFPATLLETAQAIDPNSRTLLTEFKADNKSDEILPGGYTQVHLKFPAMSHSVLLPVNTLLFRAQGLQVAILDKDNKVVLKSIKISRDFGDQVEVDSGITPGEVVIVNPSDSLATGQHVQVVSSNANKAGEGKEKTPEGNTSENKT